MKAFKELTSLGRGRRIRALANSALEEYGLASARLVFTREAGNTLYRVYSREDAGTVPGIDLFEPGQFLLRVHWTGYRDAGQIELELEWLRALREGRGLPVPEPIPTRRGDLLVEVVWPGVPEPRYCSLLRWVKGRRLGERAAARHYAAQGRLMARMHAFAEEWSPPAGAKPRAYDWDGLFREIPALCLPVDDVWSLLPQAHVRAFESVAGRVRGAMQDLGAGRDAFGLIHGDLGVDANLLFWRGHPRAIDFDELGLGYWVYDLAVALEHCREQREYCRNRDALLSGYSEVRALPREQAQYLDLFMAALDVHLGLWANAVVKLRPPREAVRRRFDRCVDLVDRYLDTGSQDRVEPVS